MDKSAQKIHASTQKFTEIVDIEDHVVLFEGGMATSIIEVTASNFALLSQKEQEAKMLAYAALLNSLTFPIQILIRNRRVDISSYIKDLEEQEQITKNPMLAKHIRLYRNFVHEMIRINVVLNKSFYLAIPFSSLEAGITGAKQAVQSSASTKEETMQLAKKILQGKADSLLPQLQKLAMSAKLLHKEDLIKLFYELYNEGDTLQVTQLETGPNVPIVKPAP